jgi:hypothetical protein
VTLTASYASVSKTAALSVNLLAVALSNVSVSPGSVVGGQSSTGTVTLTAAAGSGGAVVSLSSSNASAASVPASVTVAQGLTSATFSVTTGSVNAATSVTLTASYASVSETAGLTVNPVPTALSSVSVTPTTIVSGQSGTGTITLTKPAASGGAMVSLSSSNTAVASVPSTMMVPQGLTSATFAVSAGTVNAATNVVLSSSYAGVGMTANLTVTAPISQPPPAPGYLEATDGSVGQVNLSWTASTDSIGVSGYLVERCQAAAGTNFAQIATSTVTAYTDSGLMANTTYLYRVRAKDAAGNLSPYSNVASVTTLIVTVNPPPAALSSVSVNPATIVGGQSGTGTVSLTAAAGSGGAVVSLSSLNSNAATVPTSITIPQGSTSATFSVTTGNVTAATSVTLTASYANVSETAALTVTVNNSNPSNLIGEDTTVFVDGENKMTTPSFSATQPGDLLVAFVGYDGPINSPQTATVRGTGLPWTLLTRSNSQAGTSEIWVAQAPDVLSGVTVISVPGIHGYHGSLTVIAFTNASGTGMVNAASAASGAPDVVIPGASAGSWVFAVGHDWDNAIARVPVSGQVLVHQRIDTQTGDTYWVQATAAPSIVNGPVDIHDTSPTNDRWTYAAVEIVATHQ